MDGPAFAGVHNLLTTLQRLWRRPRVRERAGPDDMRGDQPLPIVHLNLAAQAEEFAAALHNGLTSAHCRRRIPCVRVDAHKVHDAAERTKAEREENNEPQVWLPLLKAVEEGLQEANSSDGKLTDFDIYHLADWLTRQRVPDANERDDRSMAMVLRKWAGRGGGSAGAQGFDASELTQNSVARFAIRLFAPVVMRIGVTLFRNRVPGLGRESKWFMRQQQYMVPQHSLSFLGFARRLTHGRIKSEHEEQVQKLLVHAFLQDLRVAYRRRKWSIVPRRAGWRRTAYVVLLLDNVTETNGGWELLRLLNAVRNETGLLDPLLVIVTADQAPGGAGDHAPEDIMAPGKADEGLQKWYDALPRRRQRLEGGARLLLIKPPGEDETVPSEDLNAWPKVAACAPKPSFPMLRWVVEGALALVMVPLLVLLTVAWTDHVAANCAFVEQFDDGVDVTLAGADCIGYSDNDTQVFGTSKRLETIQQKVFEQNEKVLAEHDRDPGRPYVSLIYLADLTHGGTAADTDLALAEELEGLLLRQREQNEDTTPTQPLLRIIVANAGAGMKWAPRVVDMLIPLSQRDSSIMGVVGLDRTVEQTEQAITELGLAGVTTVGTTLTGNGLVDRSPLYFQIVPPNKVQAQLVTSYAVASGVTNLTVFHAKLNAGDTFVDTLVHEMRLVSGVSGIPMRTAELGAVPEVCATAADRSHEMFFYAGRENDFGGFLRSVARACSPTDLGKLPRIVASDSVDRFMAQRESRAHPDFSGVKASFVSLGARVVLAGRRCLQGKGDGGRLNSFCVGMQSLYRELDEDTRIPVGEKPTKPWPGERVGGTYDVAGLFIDAVNQIRVRTPTMRDVHRAAVPQQWRESTYQGATGEIDFRAFRSGEDRYLAILEISDVHDFDAQLVCVHAIGALTLSPGQKKSETGCPAN
jgi:hypothetical protein